RLRAVLPENYVYVNHRRTGLGRLESAEAYIASLTPMLAMSPDAILEYAYIIAAEPHGLHFMGHSFGTTTDGGAWESFYVVLCPCEDGRFVRLEMFEPEELDAVRARFEALRPNPLRIPPNAAARALERWAACFAARDWTTLAAEYPPT